MPRITPTPELLETLFLAQAKWAKANLESWIAGYRSDDGYDDLDASLDLAQTMAMIFYEGSLSYLDELLNGSDPEKALVGFTLLGDLACDGIAPEFYALDCPALPKEV